MMLLPYHHKVSSEAANLVRSFVKPRNEELLDLVSKYNARLSFEINNLEKEITYSSDSEEISTVADSSDRQLLIK